MDPAELDKLVEEIGDAILARLPRSVCPECLARRRPAARVPLPVLPVLERGVAIASVIDHTLLRPEATREEIVELCREARHYGFASVCVNPHWVATAAAELNGSKVRVCTVAGFPLGASVTPVKVLEAATAIRCGATEIDMVLNIGALRSGCFDTVRLDIEAVARLCHRHGAIVKVILETALLDEEQKKTACALAREAGADFVKTSTGFSKAGAAAADVALMRAAVGTRMGVKASGGIRTLADLKAMLAAGATRIGASASVNILREAMASTA